MSLPVAIISLGLLLFHAPSALAHKPSDTYLMLQIRGAEYLGQWDIALRDREFAVGLEGDANGSITWGEMESRQKAAATRALEHLGISADGRPGTIRITDYGVDQHDDGAYAVLRFAVDGLSRPKRLELDFTSFFELDPQHRGLLRLDCDDQIQTAVFSPDKPAQQFEFAAPDRLGQFRAFMREGIWHIWMGYDHVLFLIALLLPSVLKRGPQGWELMSEFRPALISVLKIVTAFTVAHSVTLSLAALGLVRLPSRLVESTIAAAVGAAALNNLLPWSRAHGWVMAFGFGLIHGFGFADVLGDLGLTSGSLALPLVGFNLGVELGQLAIVAGFLPLAFMWRKHWSYQVVTLKLGSAAIAVLAAFWMFERVFGS